MPSSREADAYAYAVEAKSFTYWHPRREVATLKQVSFRIRPGEFALIAGPSGSGKSTLGLCALGVRPGLLLGRAEGDLLVRGSSSLRRPTCKIADDLGIVFQSPDDQISNLTVEDEIVFGLENHQLTRSEIASRLEEVLDLCRLRVYRKRSVWELSGGEKQRVAIASMLALKSPVLWLDEPTSNLDSAGEYQVWDTVERIRRSSDTTIIAVQHNIDHVLPLVDHVVLLVDGAVAFDGPPAELLRTHRWRLPSDWGLWLPQATDVAMRLQDRGIAITTLPHGGAAVAPWLPTELLQHHEGSRVAAKNNEPSAEPADSTTAEAPWLEVKDLTFSYGSGTRLISNVSLSVQRGEMIAIVGPNGAGKSTLTMLLVGLLQPTRGSVVVGGLRTNRASPAELGRKIAYVFQYPEHQFIANTVLDEVAHGVRALRKPMAEVATTAEAALRRIGLWEWRDRHPFNLSMGQKRRLSVACMLVTEPDGIILDEPTFGQDWLSATQLMRFMQSLNQENRTVMVVTHDMRLVAEYVSRVLVVVGGAIVFDGSAEQLFCKPDLLKAAQLIQPPVVQMSLEACGRPSLTTAAFVGSLLGDG
ncbi:MAG: ABC transporter ATP-binding protein [Chloroflexi bacterium]|nr:ABC transporter ATP-binding protein [Chloroflexota bacterium]